MITREADEPVVERMTGKAIALGAWVILDEDIEFIRRIQSGDPGSFEPLVEKYRTFVIGIIRSIVYETSIEEDLAQEIFIQAYRGLKNFRSESSFKTWLYRIAYNVCLNYLRKNRKVRFQDNETELMKVVDRAPSPDRAHERLEIKQMLDRLIRELPPRYRSILHLHYYEDISYEEISDMTGLPLGTVKSHLHRAKDRIRQMLHDEGWISRGE